MREYLLSAEDEQRGRAEIARVGRAMFLSAQDEPPELIVASAARLAVVSIMALRRRSPKKARLLAEALLVEVRGLLEDA
ncbi:MAG TPA: hypothetical protein VFV05_08815 [Methylomirabilota bacterium]|nr:hypothetical protein [Methylomirabilota bacterium]